MSDASGYRMSLLLPIAPGGAQAIYDSSPSHSVLGCSGHSSPVGPLVCCPGCQPLVCCPGCQPLVCCPGCQMGSQVALGVLSWVSDGESGGPLVSCPGCQKGSQPCSFLSVSKMENFPCPGESSGFLSSMLL